MTAMSASPAVPSRTAHPLLVLLAILGIVAFLYGVLQGSAPRVWGIYLVNLLFWSSLAITGPALAAMIQVTEGRWSPSVKRIALTTAGFLPVSFVLFLVLFFGRATLYPWVNEPLADQGRVAQRAVHVAAHRARACCCCTGSRCGS